MIAVCKYFEVFYIFGMEKEVLYLLGFNIFFKVNNYLMIK